MRIMILRKIDDLIFGNGPHSDEIKFHYNIGNKLWFMGLVSTICTEENEIEFMGENTTADEINSQYDICIKPSANLFSAEFAHFLESNTSFLQNIKIPVYVISCGAQASSYDDLVDLAESIRNSAVPFIEAIYNTGGEFALRGNFTKSLFDYYGYNTAVVTGCPSLYQFGSFKIKKTSQNEIKLICNGDMQIARRLLSRCKGTYFDQSTFFYEYSENKTSSIKEAIKRYGYDGTDLLFKGKVQLLPDIPQWFDYIHGGGYNFSVGTKIHGSIVALLSGIPAVVCPPDTRVKEMCDFFQIPMIKKEELNNLVLSELYEDVNYDDFNRVIDNNINVYAKFLVDHHIVEKAPNYNNIFYEFNNTNNCNRIDDIKVDTNLSRLWNFLSPIYSVARYGAIKLKSV